MIPKLGPMELVVILLVILVIFGPKNLPKLGSAIGASVKNLRDSINGGSDKASASMQADAAAKTTEPAVIEEAEEISDKPSPKHVEKEAVGVH